MSEEKKLPCYYALGGLNFKNGFATSCPTQSDHLHILDDKLPSEFWNNKYFRQHRKDLMSGKWCRGCHLCAETEADASGKSMRMDYPADETYYDPETGAVDFKGLYHVELRFSNSCNMACMHCSDVYSSGWMSKLKKYTPTMEDHTYQLNQLTRSMHRKTADEDLSIDISISEMEKIVDDLCENFPNIEKVDFAGGEVLHQKQFFPCLERLAKHPNAENILLTFHTNFNARFDPIKLSELLEPFGRSSIKMSLDAGKNMYSYFRDGDWEKLKSNVEQFKSVNDFTDLEVVCTTSVYQLMDLPDIFESFLTLDVKIIEASIVFTPKYLNPAIMMFDFKEHVLNDIAEAKAIVQREKAKRYRHLDQYKHRRSYLKGKNTFEDIESALKSLDMIKHYVLNHKTEYIWWESFEVYRRKIDKLWGKDYNSTIKRYQWDDNNKLHRVENTEMTGLDKTNGLYKILPYTEGGNVNKAIDDNNNEINDKIDHYREYILEGQKEIALEFNEDNLGERVEALVQFIKKARLEIEPEVKDRLDRLDEEADKAPEEGDERKLKRYKCFQKEVYIIIDWAQEEIRKLQSDRTETNRMILDTSGLKTHIVDGVAIPLNPDWKRIGVNLSGGADSCSLAYTLASIIKENGYDTKIDVITHTRVWENRPWAGPVSVNVFNKLKEMFPDIIEERHTNFIPSEVEHGAVGFYEGDRSIDQIIVNSYNNYLAKHKKFNAIFNATTKNPSMETPTEDRMRNRDVNLEEITIDQIAQNRSSYWILLPLMGVEKNWVIKRYHDNNILDLLNTTRSCEGDGTKSAMLKGTDVDWYDESKDVPECGQCFWCHERNWAKQKVEENNEL